MPKTKRIALSLNDLDLDKFTKAINKVELSKIRIESDEVTYNLHIIIRFEIERDLFAEKITINELPQVWNQKYAEYLGVEIKDDSEGVMQDTHWASGLYGYFPSYALGNIYTGQLAAAITRDLPDWQNQVALGKMNSVNKWLRTKVHRQGNLYDPQELMKEATGGSLNPEPYLSYLNKKYGYLYGF